MILVLNREYYPSGTNGKLTVNGESLCKTIELPWRHNQQRISCIPEGTYTLIKRYSPKFQWHLQLLGVTNRDSILIHPANDALKELKGCIAPVTTHTGEGRGKGSRNAFEQLKSLVYPILERGSIVKLIIKTT